MKTLFLGIVAGAMTAPLTAAPVMDPGCMRAQFPAALLARVDGGAALSFIDNLAVRLVPAAPEEKETYARRQQAETPTPVQQAAPITYPPERAKSWHSNVVSVFGVVAADGSVGDVLVYDYRDADVAKAAALAMKRCRYAPSEHGAVVWRLFTLSRGRPDVPATEGPIGDPGLREELLRREKMDQAIRARIDRNGSKSDPALGRELAATDRENTRWMKTVLRRQGWPGNSLVGSEGAGAAWLLVQHADHDPAFQREALALMMAAFDSGEVAASHYALLTDRVLVAEGKPQIYGSQVKREGESYVPQPIEHAAEVDARRALMGLPALADYLREINRR